MDPISDIMDPKSAIMDPISDIMDLLSAIMDPMSDTDPLSDMYLHTFGHNT